jgi:peptidylprolyl isomerase
VRLLRLSVLLLLPIALVAGCSSSGSGKASSSPTASGTASLTGVTVTGAADKAPTIALAKTPFSVPSTVTKVLTPGTGAAIPTGALVRLNYFLVDGADGKEKDSTFGKTSVVFSTGTGQLLPGLIKGMVNQKIGSRVLVAIPPADAFGTAGNTTLGVAKTDTLVFVMDLKSMVTPLAAPKGAAVTPAAKLPTVKPDSTGAPVVTLPSGAAPTKLVTQPLIKGTGAVVKSGQTVSVNYVGVIWPGGKVFDSSYARNQAADFVIGQGQVIPGWDHGLVGKAVGSRVLLVVPPDEGYGTKGNTQAGIKGSDTLVFVVDILGAV